MLLCSIFGAAYVLPPLRISTDKFCGELSLLMETVIKSVDKTLTNISRLIEVVTKHLLR